MISFIMESEKTRKYRLQIKQEMKKNMIRRKKQKEIQKMEQRKFK